MTLYCVLSIIIGIILVVNSIFTFKEHLRTLGGLTVGYGIILIALGVIWFIFRQSQEELFDLIIALIMAVTLVATVLTFTFLGRKPKTEAKKQ